MDIVPFSGCCDRISSIACSMSDSTQKKRGTSAGKQYTRSPGDNISPAVCVCCEARSTTGCTITGTVVSSSSVSSPPSMSAASSIADSSREMAPKSAPALTRTSLSIALQNWMAYINFSRMTDSLVYIGRSSAKKHVCDVGKKWSSALVCSVNFMCVPPMEGGMRDWPHVNNSSKRRSSFVNAPTTFQNILATGCSAPPSLPLPKPS
mmetsp:Transcript_8069/g.12791  ORF Transcript_8069/g.12791 Transcript_8069/m.12791 type:complete len:207 (-) Transcript_8069:7511-8131(-)